MSSLAQLWTWQELEVLTEQDKPATPEELSSRTPPEGNDRERWVWRGDLPIEERPDGTRYYRTLDGSIPIYECIGVEDCSWQGCQHQEGRVLVRGYATKWPTHVEIAIRCGLTSRQVRARIESAHRKIMMSLQERALRESNGET